MGILSAIWRLISKIFSVVLGWLKKLFSRFFWIILIVAIIWFAPVIAAWLTSVGAPSFVVSMFEAISVATPYVQSAGSWLWDKGSSLVSSAWSSFRGLDAGTQASVALGAAALLAPEETANLVSDAGGLLVDAIGTIGGALFSNPWIMVAGGLAIYWMLLRKKDDVKLEVANAQAA